jgi:four helix bundle protein
MGYKELIVWQPAMELVVEIYRGSEGFPREETYGLVAQMRRAAVSIPSNIAEGKGRYTQKEIAQFLINARGSLLELETQIQIANRLAYMKGQETEELTRRCSEVGRLLNGMITHFKQLSPAKQHPET